ncbi:MAG: SET domain-containing protein-lysine N-methyltransferase [Hyphomicrobiaceae bacterium]|nr:SET domain-containing protein-lysine N-methyltransferase [Hyphomicrobiaceae bacterium]
MPLITVRMTDAMGRGVFAVRDIAAGDVLGAFHTIRLPPAEVAAIRDALWPVASSTLPSYWFEDDADGSALIVLGWLELVNHARTPNLDRTWRTAMDGEIVTVLAARDIAAGEQLTIDYRFDPADPKTPPWA